MNIIYAPNIHCGGGKVLLDNLIDEIKNLDDWYIIVDARLEIPNSVQEKILFRVKPTIFGRFSAEIRIHSISKKTSNILFLGNLPPVFKSSAKVHLFIQNMYLVSKQSIDGFNFRSRLRIFAESIWLKLFIGNADRVIVQSETMRRQLLVSLGCDAEIIPFFKKRSDHNILDVEEIFNKFSLNIAPDFIYVASGEPHKNHRVLIEAWKLLANKNIFPSLFLTLDQNIHPQLCNYIESEVKEFNLRIRNLGPLTHHEVKSLYSVCKTLVYPSLFESFGLPIYEARQAGLAVVAAELDYVRDLTNPEQTFNPYSAKSLSRAIERFLNIKPILIKPITPLEFILKVR